MRRVAALLCLLAGCDALFGLDRLDPSVDGGAGVDAPFPDSAKPLDARCDRLGPRVLLQDIGGSHEPTLSADRRDLYFVRDNTTGLDIYHASRLDPTQPFGEGQLVAGLSSAFSDTDPALTADGLLIVFKSNRSGADRAYQAKRTATSVFASPELVPGLEMTMVSGIDISPDGLTLYVDDGLHLIIAARPARSEPIETLVVVADRTPFPSASSDGLELYYNGEGVVRRTRGDTSEPFLEGTATVVDESGRDADVLADDSALVFTAGPNNDVVYMRDLCP